MRTIAALIMTALVAAPAFAQPPRGGMRGGFGVNLTNKSVQQELKLTDDQIKKVTEFGEKMRTEFPFDPNADQEKRREMGQKRMEATEKFNKETLTADQAKRYTEIRLQVTGLIGVALNPGNSPANEETAKSLKLTDDQKEKLKEIGQTMFKDMQELRTGGGGFDAETQKKVQALQKEASAKAMETLTSDQKKTWEEMTGKPFDYKPEFGQGGGAGKGKGKKKPEDK